jgi:hypothetical protein
MILKEKKSKSIRKSVKSKFQTIVAKLEDGNAESGGSVAI